jgi:glucosyl-dolichyl phosphate glucuronosyltransferase
MSVERAELPAATLDCSVIVCTYNRAASLADTLRALQALEIPAGLRWEVVVVDNNSKDDTRQVVDAFARGFPQLRYVFQPLQGLSRARNLGIEEARGEYLLFTDDDVLPETDWLRATMEGLRGHQADACGGYIAPIFEVPPPHWLTERFYGFLAVRTDRTDDYPITQASQAPFGANMAMHRRVFSTVGLFDTSRGRSGKVLASGEDGELFERILSAGLKAVFLGGARVRHKVEAFRLTKTYLRKWRYQSSRNIAISRGLPGKRRLCGVPLFIFFQTMRAAARAGYSRFASEPDEAFNRELILFHFFGTMAGLFYRNNEGRWNCI